MSPRRPSCFDKGKKIEKPRRQPHYIIKVLEQIPLSALIQAPSPIRYPHHTLLWLPHHLHPHHNLPLQDQDTVHPFSYHPLLWFLHHTLLWYPHHTLLWYPHQALLWFPHYLHPHHNLPIQTIPYYGSYYFRTFFILKSLS